MAAPANSDATRAFELMRAGRLLEALPFAERAAAAARTASPTHGFLAALLLKLGRLLEAKQVLERALSLPTGIADAYDGLAYVALTLRQHERANDLYRKATELSPREPRFWYNLAGSERSLGRLEAAEAACDQAIAIDPAQYPTYLLRSELRVQTGDFNHIDELRKLWDHAASDQRARMFLGYALGKELDDVRRFDEAFRYFSTAASARRSRLAYDVATDERKLSRIAEVFSEQWLNERPAHTEKTVSTPVFIVGLPRSGTTLVERILTGLAGVRSNGETENFSRALIENSGAGGDVFEKASQADFEAVARRYEQLANPEGAAGPLIEKLPMNYLYLGAIRRSLPQAKIIALSRSPLDSCFAMYRTLFGDAYPFSYDFEDLGRYFGAYRRLLQHWHSLMGDSLHKVVYEELVQEPSRVGARIASYVGLPWKEEAIEIQNNRSVSLTASASQVRRPIYGSSSGRWRHYEQSLSPLIGVLKRQGIETP